VHSEPAWRTACVYEPRLPQPGSSSIPSLAAGWRPGNVVAIAPASDETRRTMPPATVHALIAGLARQHPGCAVEVLVNPADEEVRPLLAAGLPPGAQFRRFHTLQELVAILCRLRHLHTTDTGLYHLATAIGVPTTTYYGPTQPWKNGFPAQPRLTRVRIAALGGEHCEEKGCQRPVCLEKAVALSVGATADADIGRTPPGCLLRQHAPEELERIAVLTDAAQAVLPVH